MPRVRIKREMNPIAPVCLWLLRECPRKIKTAERLVLGEVFHVAYGWEAGGRCLWLRLKPGLQLALGFGLVLGLGASQTLELQFK